MVEARRILQDTDPILRTQCAPVTEGYELRKLFDEMERAMKFPAGIGLAAPQIGESVQAIVFRVPHGRGEVRQAIANPEIYWTNRRLGSIAKWEGCLSFKNGIGFRCLVKRFRHVKVRGIDENFEPIQFGAREILARVIQHEVDHLNGVLMIDRAIRTDEGDDRRRKLMNGS